MTDQTTDTDSEGAYRTEMNRLTTLLVERILADGVRVDALMKTCDCLKEDADKKSASLSVEIAEVKRRRDEKLQLKTRTKSAARDIKRLDRANDRLTIEFGEIEREKKSAQQNLADKAATHARMCRTAYPPQRICDYTSSKTRSLDAKMDAVRDNFRKNEMEVLKIRKEIEMLTGMELDKVVEALDNQLSVLTENVARVRVDLTNALHDFRSLSRGIFDAENTLTLAKMLSDYEEYLKDYLHKSPSELWQTIRSGKGKYHCDWDEDAGDVDGSDINCFDEYLYTLVGTCNRHWYEILKATYVADCGCHRKLDYEQDSWCSHTGFCPNDKRCSHGVKMWWVDDDDWDADDEWLRGMMFSDHTRQLEFTIHSKIPPGEVSTD